MIVAMIMYQVMEEFVVDDYEFYDEWPIDSGNEVTSYLKDEQTPLYDAMLTKCQELELF